MKLKKYQDPFFSREKKPKISGDCFQNQVIPNFYTEEVTAKGGLQKKAILQNATAIASNRLRKQLKNSCAKTQLEKNIAEYLGSFLDYRKIQ